MQQTELFRTHFRNIRQVVCRSIQQAEHELLAAVAWFTDDHIFRELLAAARRGVRVEIIIMDDDINRTQEQEPGLKGFDRRSLYRMRDFFEQWQVVDWSLAGLSQTSDFQTIESVGQLREIVGSLTPQSPPMHLALARLSLTHHVEILRGIVSPDEKLFYLLLSIRDRYTVWELQRQIKSSLFERQMLAKHTLLVPEHPQKELLADIFRERYLFEFLDLKEPFSERELQKALIQRMKDFLLELGRDFMFFQEELHLKVGMNDYFVDLVFFHRELQCLVAFDLKIEDFKPEHLGKMNFYLELLDRDVRKPHENPLIGVVLCKSKNDEVVEIAMSRQLTPVLVSIYETKFVEKALLRRPLHDWTEEWKQQQEAL